jgi:hypothetical protein
MSLFYKERILLNFYTLLSDKLSMKFVTLILVFLILKVHAEVLEQNKLLFKFDVEQLKKGDVAYFTKCMTSKKFKAKYPQLVALDASGILENKEILVSKAVYVVTKPASFFNYHQMVDQQYLKHLFKERSIASIDENSFKMEDLRLDLYSDDINYTKKSAVVNAITESKKLDPLSIGGAASQFNHFTSDKKDSLSSSVINYVSLSPKKTLLIVYSITAMKEKESEDIMKKRFIEDLLKDKERVDQFDIKQQK